jgi:hypothetical protein
MQYFTEISVVGYRTLCDQQCICRKGWLLRDEVKGMLLFAEQCVILKRHFYAHIGTRWAPAKQTICRLKKQFEEDGLVLERKGPHAPRVYPREHGSPQTGSPVKPEWIDENNISRIGHFTAFSSASSTLQSVCACTRQPWCISLLTETKNRGSILPLG